MNAPTEALVAKLEEMTELANQWERFNGNITDSETKRAIEEAYELIRKAREA